MLHLIYNHVYCLHQCLENPFTDADNLLLTANHKSVKLADFGLAREESVTEMMTAETGTYRWMAPEVCAFLLHILISGLLVV